MGPKKENNALIKGQEAEDLVKNYLKEQYRPYSVSDLILNLHNKVNKVTMTKCLESLVSKNEIISKTYGKMVFYVYKEEEINSDLEAEINVESVNKIKADVEEISKKVKDLQDEYNELTKSPTNEEAVAQSKELEKELVILESKLDSIKNEGNTRLSKKEIEKYKAYNKELERIFRQRKKLVNDFLSMVREGIENYSAVLDELGIDLDHYKELSNICI